MEKYVKKYAKLYKSALTEKQFSNIGVRVKSFEQRLKEMYESDIFAEHNVYPTMDVFKIYAVIAMCLELKEDHLSNAEIIEFVNTAFRKVRRLFAALEKAINILPCSYQIAKKWNISDHENRVKDSSITYDYFNVSEGKIEYRISKCMYIEMFDYYGIRGLCKIFCLTDEFAYSNLPKHVKFIRYSDLSDGECCHDEVVNRKYIE